MSKVMQYGKHRALRDIGEDYQELAAMKRAKAERRQARKLARKRKNTAAVMATIGVMP